MVLIYIKMKETMLINEINEVLKLDIKYVYMVVIIKDLIGEWRK